MKGKVKDTKRESRWWESGIAPGPHGALHHKEKTKRTHRSHDMQFGSQSLCCTVDSKQCNLHAVVEW